MRQLIPDSLNSKLDDIVTKCFAGNRIADRGMSVLSVKFTMNKTEKHLHPTLAHKFPKLADDVSGFQDSRNNLTVYGLTPEDKSDYSHPSEFFERMLEYMYELETLISEAADMAREEDFATYAFLLKFINKVSEVTSQCILLADKSEAYKDDIMGFDHRIKDFIILWYVYKPRWNKKYICMQEDFGRLSNKKRWYLFVGDKKQKILFC